MNEIRSITRALMVLRIMNERSIWSLQELHTATGLPKSTLHRILWTLRLEHYVRNDEGMYGSYQLTSKTSDLSRGITEQSQLVDVAGPVLIRMTKKIKWPLSLGIVQGHQIRVAFCTMPYSPYAIRPSSYGRLYNLFDSALGRAYFSFCSKAERRILYDLYQTQAQDGDMKPSWRELRSLIAETTRQGYGIRYGRKISDSSAFAVPVYANGELVAAITYSIFSGSLNAEILTRFLPILDEVSTSIGTQLGDS